MVVTHRQHQEQLLKSKVILFFYAWPILLEVQAQQPRLILPIGHVSIVNTVCFSPDGKRILTSSADNTAKIWDAQSGLLLVEFRDENSQVISASYSPDGEKVLTAGDSTARIWDAVSGELLIKLKGHSDRIQSACFSPDGKKIATASMDSTAGIWDAVNGSLLTVFKGYVGGVYFTCFSSDGKKLITTTMDNSIKMWNAVSGELLFSINGQGKGVQIACFSPDNRKIVTASSLEHTAKIWNADNGAQLIELKGHIGAIKSVCFSKDGSRVLTTGDKTAKLWDVGTGKLLADLTGHGELVTRALFSPDDKLVLTVSRDHTARIWNTVSGALLYNLTGHSHSVTDGCFSPDGEKIATASEDHSARIWDVESGTLLADMKSHNNLVSSFFSPDGRKVVTSSWDNINTRIWDELSGEQLTKLCGHPDWVRTACISSNGKMIVTASDDHTAKIWDASEGTVLTNLQGHNDRINTACFSPDGKMVVTASSDHTAKIWDAKSGLMLADIKGPGNSIVSCASFSPDNEKIVAAYYDNSGRIWNIKTGKPIADLKGHTKVINSACFSPDGKKIVTSSYDNHAMVWDAESGSLLADLKGHTDQVSSAAFSPDSKMIVTASWDRTARIWDASNGSLIAELGGQNSAVAAACFTSDGRKIITAYRDNTSKIWDVDRAEVLSTFFAADSSEYFIQIPTGYYFCTPAASKLLHYVDKDLKVITFEQLDVKFNRPDLVMEALGNPDTALIHLYRTAWEKRINRLGFDPSLFTGGFHVPQAELTNRDSVEYEQKTNKLIIKIKAEDDSLVLDRYNVWINEVPLFGVKGISLKYRNTRFLDTALTVTVGNGENRIEASVTNIDGLESYREPLDVNYTPPTPTTEKLFFIGIGMDHFKDNRYDLRWSVKDIRDLARSFKNKYGEACIIDTLFDQEVSTAQVQALKQKLLTTTENDKVIIAYSGHGLLSRDYDYFLSTYDVNFQHPQKGGLPYEALEDLLDGIPARKKLMLIDACHSGEVDKEELSTMIKVQNKLDSTKKGVEVLVDTTSKKFGTRNSFELMQEVFVNVGRSTGATVIAAAAGTQFALERGDLKNGVFSYSILEMMKGRQSVTISELEKYVNQRVTELTQGLQVPTARNENNVMDWQVW